MKNALILTLILAVAAIFGTPAPASATCNVSIRPNLVSIGTNFNGTTLAVKGEIPKDTTAVIRLLGEPHTKSFKKKGRALGVLWMNLGTIELENVPDVFLIGTDGNGNMDLVHSNFGFESIKGETDDLIFDEFIKLMEIDDLYQVQQGIITYKDGENGSKTFEASLSIPSAMHKGVYEVELLAIKDGKVVEKSATELHSELTGFPKMLSVVAFDHSLLYGIGAAIIAILAGLAMTLLFKDKGGAH